MEQCRRWQGLVGAQLDVLHQAWDAAAFSLLPYLTIEAALGCSSSRSLPGGKGLRVPAHPPWAQAATAPGIPHRARDG